MPMPSIISNQSTDARLQPQPTSSPNNPSKQLSTSPDLRCLVDPKTIASSKLVQIPLWGFGSKIQQRKDAKKESRGTLDHFVKLSEPEIEVLV